MPPTNKKTEAVKDSVINVTVAFLDEHVESFKVLGRCLGQQLYDLVIGKLGSFEYQYFDLAFLDVEGNHNGRGFLYSFIRYLFALQLKRDFFNGLLHSNRNTSLLLAAFIVQSELGDYMETECKSYAYLKKHHLLRSAPDSYLMRVMELHQTLV
ncbi:putative 4.1 G protein [Fasciolopsis buskii]|uniref:Putative 4.1 G protein n=1 Tax=Fasciolopsis buskii TaxID=27845 RepID=A0A8E0RUT9_9TREM|nr:putative 4.1 G protein [Fasciolopsis buski]